MNPLRTILAAIVFLALHVREFIRLLRELGTWRQWLLDAAGMAVCAFTLWLLLWSSSAADRGPEKDGSALQPSPGASLPVHTVAIEPADYSQPSTPNPQHDQHP